MKKFFSIIAALTLSLGFTACEDVPAPYEVNDQYPETQPEDKVKQLPYSEAFSTTLGAFENYTVSGAGKWVIDHNTAKASGYNNEDKTTTAGTYLLVSPEISLENQTEAHVMFEYILMYNKDFANQKILISDNFDMTKPNDGWQEMPLKMEVNSPGTWQDFKSADLQVPAAFMGKKIRLAFYYNTNNVSGSTLEIRNFTIAAGKAEQGGEEEPQNPNAVQQLPYNESFASDLGNFKNFTTSGAGAWINEYSTAKASGYNNADKTTTAGTYLLVSPEISLANQKEVHLMFEYILMYNKDFANQKVLITKNFDEKKPGEGWQELSLQMEVNEPGAWKDFKKADVQIPAEYLGGNIRLAYYYNCDNVSGSTWEVKNFSIAAGKVGSGEEGGQGGDGNHGDLNSTNGDFEAWVNGLPNNWQSASSASKGGLSMSEDAHSGKYAVKIDGSSSGNSRLAYKELELQSGNYTMSFYVKAATSEGGSIRPGYAIVVNGSVSNGDGYKYGEYVNDLSNSQWTAVTHQFKLEQPTTVCMVVMNAKKPGKDVLVDDFTLTDANGTAIIK